MPPRREDPEHAVLDVVISPASGARGAPERSAAGCVAAALQPVLLDGLHPRTGISLMLQARP